MNSLTKADINKSIGKVLKEYRIKNGYTQEKIAEELGISVKYISRVENGTGGIKLETLVNYINILSIPPELLFKDVMLNEKQKKDLELYNKIKELSDNKKDVAIHILEIFEKYNF